jgi:hypothetical protein
MAKALPGAVSSCIVALCQTDVDAKYASQVQLGAGYKTRIQTLVPVASFTAPKDWNFAVLGVFATSDVAGEWEGGREGQWCGWGSSAESKGRHNYWAECKEIQ